MAADQSILIPRVKLGNQGFEVSKLGFGCMGLTGNYNDLVPKDVGISIIKHAFDHGVTFFDTSDIYGANNANEILVGKALKQLPREKVQLATKFGVVKFDLSSGVAINGTPEYVRSCCEASLKHLDVEYIDLYYQNRIDTSVPIEDTMGELKNSSHFCYTNGVVTLDLRNRRRNSPTLQGTWNWNSSIQSSRQRVFWWQGSCGKYSNKQFSAITSKVYRREFCKNKILYWKIEKLAEKHGCTPAQLALAWILHQGDDVVPIPGTTKIKNLDNNIGCIKVKLTNEDLQEISAAVPINEVAGERTPDISLCCTWKFANTPPKHI
ncbi:hypothetical protein LWI29_021963 [Acer saccharum]|uniref:NADP-dependent oxidoreductase domain-containing protein n=1 Tax=Acer saccharum TaxID=4024 RepID=A0AA39VWE4_ACESA|nr:hypothetical protein LWI29_021963 [Acer saccharum]